MLRFCTLFDKNYATKGLSMYESLLQTCKQEFTLSILCLDNEAFEILKSLNLRGVMLTTLEMLEATDPALRVTKCLPPSNYGSQRDNYYWALTPYFINHVLNRSLLADGEKLMYVDSDIFFYKSPEAIFDAMGNKSMAIHTHRFSGSFNENHDVGYFNVGVVVFAATPNGKVLANFWKSLVMTTNHTWYEKYGTCGDQKYLDLLYSNSPNEIFVFDQDAAVHHGAPWCAPDTDLSKLHFYHFSHFNIVGDFSDNSATWKDSNKGEWNPAADAHVRTLYENYFFTIGTWHLRILNKTTLTN